MIKTADVQGKGAKTNGKEVDTAARAKRHGRVDLFLRRAEFRNPGRCALKGKPAVTTGDIFYASFIQLYIQFVVLVPRKILTNNLQLYNLDLVLVFD